MGLNDSFVKFHIFCDFSPPAPPGDPWGGPRAFERHQSTGAFERRQSIGAFDRQRFSGATSGDSRRSQGTPEGGKIGKNKGALPLCLRRRTLPSSPSAQAASTLVRYLTFALTLPLSYLPLGSPGDTRGNVLEKFGGFFG